MCDLQCSLFHILTTELFFIYEIISVRIQLPFETELYYLQHVLILVISFYLMHLGGQYADSVSSVCTVM